MITILGIDPGKSGAIAVYTHPEGEYRAMKIPYKPNLKGRRPKEILDDDALYLALSDFYLTNTHIFIEKVHAATPQMGKSSVATFQDNITSLRWATMPFKNTRHYVTARDWQKFFVGKSGQGKEAIKKRAAELWPDVRITAWNQDAFGILSYGLDQMQITREDNPNGTPN